LLLASLQGVDVSLGIFVLSLEFGNASALLFAVLEGLVALGLEFGL
jgi:hypothetical protein